MCKLPVTFGGGAGTTNVPFGWGVPSGRVLGAKNPCAFHHSYHAASTAMGLYPAAIGSDISATASEGGGGVGTQYIKTGPSRTLLFALGRIVHERDLIFLLVLLDLGFSLSCRGDGGGFEGFRS
jgi:hypothetical protein